MKSFNDIEVVDIETIFTKNNWRITSIKIDPGEGEIKCVEFKEGSQKPTDIKVGDKINLTGEFIWDKQSEEYILKISSLTKK